MNAEKGRIRNLAVWGWHHTDLSAAKLHELLNLTSFDKALEYWQTLCTVYALPEAEKACIQGQELEFEYGKNKTRILCPGDDGYPVGLYVIKKAPIVCVRGDIGILSKPQIAVVGSRNVCASAKSVTPMIADDVMCRGFIITSGGAAGIDALAHRQAMQRKQPTVVVSAMGTDKIFPKENADIFEYARESGAVISQFPNRNMDYKPNFPQRNDVIAALSEATIIVQCRQKSGAIYTAKAAARFHRPVMAAAMPGFDELTEGGLECIKSGMATMLSSVHDFDRIDLPNQKSFSFEILNRNMDQECEQLPYGMFSDTQSNIVNVLKKGAMTRELLRSDVQFPADFDESLLELELSGVIACNVGQYRLLRQV